MCKISVNTKQVIILCGILGIFNTDGKLINPINLQRMTDIMSHRGPDDRGFLLANPDTKKTRFFDHDFSFSDISDFMPTIGLGHRRLSIIDIKTGKQPMCNEDGTIWIVFNGEIYNFREIRKELEVMGHRFHTSHSDTEAIIHAYEEWGEKCLQQLSGMFAFGIVDLNNRKLFLARDRMGKKPLYYYHSPGKFIFASEIKAILEDASVPRKIDVTSLADYLDYMYIPSPKTIFNNIYKLRPRHYITIDFESISSFLPQREYWDIQFNPDESISESEWCDRLHSELTRAIKIRMVSDVPMGVLLSGGIDSSIIVALMSKLQANSIKTFSIGFEKKALNDLPYARQIAKKYNTEHYEEIITPNAIEILPKLAWQYDEPFADSSAIPTYYVSQMARKHVTVVLSGDAGDELFAGYNHYERALKYHNRFDGIPYAVRKILFGYLASIFPDALKGKNALTLLSLPQTIRQEYLLMGIPWWNKLLRKKIRVTLENSPRPRFFFQFLDRVKTHDDLTQMQYIDLSTHLPEDILVKVDRASMLNSLEVRAPFLDHRLIEITALMPSHLKMRKYDKKYILKQMMLDEFGKKFLYRDKTGFGLPLEYWFRSNLHDYTQDVLLNTKSFISQFIDYNAIRSVLNNHNKGMRNFSPVIWCLLFLEHWGKAYKADI